MTTNYVGYNKESKIFKKNPSKKCHVHEKKPFLWNFENFRNHGVRKVLPKFFSLTFLYILRSLMTTNYVGYNMESIISKKNP